MTRPRTMYMHTLDGKPAGWDGVQIVFADQMPNWEDRPFPVQIYAQLRTLKNHVRLSTRFRKRQGWSIGEYGWCEVEAPR